MSAEPEPVATTMRSVVDYWTSLYPNANPKRSRDEVEEEVTRPRTRARRPVLTIPSAAQRAAVAVSKS
jgi:hypothetical protein